MKVPIKRINKREVEWLALHNCRHGHDYLTHYQCYLDERPDNSPYVEKIGHLDIEASNLNADFGYMLSYAIKEDGGKILGRALRPKEIKDGLFDRNLIEEMVTDIKKFHRVTVFYGGDHRFDLPFIRTRAMYHRVAFPLYRDVFCTDCWPIVRNKFKLHRNGLVNICELLGIVAKTKPMHPKLWCLAQMGDQDSLDYIWEHNVEDVISLEGVYNAIKDYVPVAKRSI